MYSIIRIIYSVCVKEMYIYIYTIHVQKRWILNMCSICILQYIYIHIIYIHIIYIHIIYIYIYILYIYTYIYIL